MTSPSHEQAAPVISADSTEYSPLYAKELGIDTLIYAISEAPLNQKFLIESTKITIFFC